MDAMVEMLLAQAHWACLGLEGIALPLCILVFVHVHAGC
jgi:hypothetical protein